MNTQRYIVILLCMISMSISFCKENTFNLGDLSVSSAETIRQWDVIKKNLANVVSMASFGQIAFYFQTLEKDPFFKSLYKTNRDELNSFLHKILDERLAKAKNRIDASEEVRSLRWFVDAFDPYADKEQQEKFLARMQTVQQWELLRPSLGNTVRTLLLKKVVEAFQALENDSLFRFYYTTNRDEVRSFFNKILDEQETKKKSAVGILEAGASIRCFIMTFDPGKDRVVQDRLCKECMAHTLFDIAINKRSAQPLLRIIKDKELMRYILLKQITESIASITLEYDKNTRERLGARGAFYGTMGIELGAAGLIISTILLASVATPNETAGTSIDAGLGLAAIGGLVGLYDLCGTAWYLWTEKKLTPKIWGDSKLLAALYKMKQEKEKETAVAKLGTV